MERTGADSEDGGATQKERGGLEDTEWPLADQQEGNLRPEATRKWILSKT